MLEIDLATNRAMAALNVAFNAYILKMLRARKYFFHIIKIKILIAAARKGKEIGQSSNCRKKLKKFMVSTHQKLIKVIDMF